MGMNVSDLICILQVNEEFLRLSEAYFVTKYNVDSAENMLQEMLMKPRTDGKKINVQHQTMVIKCLKMVRAKLASLSPMILLALNLLALSSGSPVFFCFFVCAERSDCFFFFFFLVRFKGK